MKKKEKVKLFVSEHCRPCSEVKRMVREGKFNLEDIDMIDLETEEGFPYIEKMNLTRVPAAYQGEKVCQLQVDHENDVLIITCPGDE